MKCQSRTGSMGELWRNRAQAAGRTEAQQGSGGRKELHHGAQPSREDLSLGLCILRSLWVLPRVWPEYPRVWTDVRESRKTKIFSVLEGWLWGEIRRAVDATTTVRAVQGHCLVQRALQSSAEERLPPVLWNPTRASCTRGNCSALTIVSSL